MNNFLYVCTECTTKIFNLQTAIDKKCDCKNTITERNIFDWLSNLHKIAYAIKLELWQVQQNLPVLFSRK